MSLAVTCLLLAACVAFYIVSYRWLMKTLRRRQTAQNAITYSQRWLVGFCSILPLCAFAGYAIFHSSAFAASLIIGFSLVGAAVAAASGLPVVPSVGRAPVEPLDGHLKR